MGDAASRLDIVLRMLTEGNFQGALNEINQLQGASKATNEEQAVMAAGARELNTQLHEQDAASAATAAGLNRIAVAGAIATAALAGAGKAVAEFAEKEQAIIGLDAALANQGQLVDSVREKYQALADEIEETLGIADDKALKAIATLTKFGAKPEQMEGFLEAVKNLAGFIGGDLESAAFDFGKAISGSFGMLGRYGIEVKENATQTEKLNSVMEQLAQRGGGQLEARAHSLTGGFTGLKLGVGNLFEGIGNLISRSHVLQVSMEVLRGVLSGLASLLPGTVEQSDKLANKFGEVATAAGSAADAAATAQKKTEEAIKAANDALDAQIAKLLRIQNLHDRVLGEVTAGKLAEVDKDEAEGRLKPHEAEAARTKIKRDAQLQQLAEEEIAQRKIMGVGTGARSGADAAVSKAAQDADAAQAAVDASAAATGLDPENLKNLSGRAQIDRAKAQRRIDENTPGSTLGIPNRTQTPEMAAKVSAAEQEIKAIDERVAAIERLKTLNADAAAKETEYQAALINQKAVYDSTKDAIQSAADALEVLQEKYKRFQKESGLDSAKGLRDMFKAGYAPLPSLDDYHPKAAPSGPRPGTTAFDLEQARATARDAQNKTIDATQQGNSQGADAWGRIADEAMRRIQALEGKSGRGRDSAGVATGGVSDALASNTGALENLGEVIIAALTEQNRAMERIVDRCTDIQSYVRDMIL